MVDVPTPPFGDLVTEEILRERMLDSMLSDLDRAEGSLPFSLISPVALEIDQVYEQLDIATELGFAQTTYGGFLDARAEEHGIFRREATFAEGEVTITGTNDVVIPEGFLLSTEGEPGSSPVIFMTTEEATIAAGTATIPVIAVTVGAEGNVPIGSVTQVVGFLEGVTGVNNAAEMAGGADEESDDDLRVRLLAAVAAARGAGTAGDYEVWALEVPGVGSASATPVWDGPGTVLVMILDIDGAPAGAPLIAEVAAHIATLSPIGADVTVDTPTPVAVDVEVTVTPEAGFTVGSVTDAVEASIAAYFATLNPGDDVILTEVGAAIVTTQGVADYSGLELETVAANFTIASDELAQVGTVTVS